MDDNGPDEDSAPSAESLTGVHNGVVRFSDIPRYLVSQNVYYRIARFLAKVPSSQTQIALSFRELSEILGRDLPSSALSHRPWWGNTENSPQGSAWLATDWSVENVFLKTRIVVFRRKGGSPLREVPLYVKSLLGEGRYSAHPDSRRLGEWLRFCRYVAWYFEGTILYEKTGLADDGLSDVERAEVEEDYSVCKRELNRYRNS